MVGWIGVDDEKRIPESIKSVGPQECKWDFVEQSKRESVKHIEGGSQKPYKRGRGKRIDYR